MKHNGFSKIYRFLPVIRFTRRIIIVPESQIFPIFFPSEIFPECKHFPAQNPLVRVSLVLIFLAIKINTCIFIFLINKFTHISVLYVSFVAKSLIEKTFEIISLLFCFLYAYDYIEDLQK